MDNPLELLAGIAAILMACAGLITAAAWAYRSFATSTQVAHDHSDRKDQEMKTLLENGLRETKDALARSETRHREQIGDLKNDYEKRTNTLAGEVRELARKVHTLEGEKKALMDTELNLRGDLNLANQQIGQLRAELNQERAQRKADTEKLTQENERLRRDNDDLRAQVKALLDTMIAAGVKVQPETTTGL